MRCRIYRTKEGESYLIPQCHGCTAGDEIEEIGPEEMIKRYCTCTPPEKRGSKGDSDKRDIKFLEHMLDDQQKVINHLLKRIGELKKPPSL